jgi:arabinofuranosyltransferase
VSEPRPRTASLPQSEVSAEPQARLLTAGLLAVFLVVLVRTAWLSDDSYINFRTIDNVLHGYGLRWNVVDRVQSFTDPLWLFLVTACVFVTREFYYTVVVLSILLSGAAVVLIARRIALDTTAAIVGIVLLLASKAFVDFSTSGLEGPLTHFLLVAFLAVYWNDDADGDARTRKLSLLTALLMLTRIDASLLVLPALLLALIHRGVERGVRGIRPAAWGLALVVVWEGFSLLYFGFPLPNTAYAKLGGGVPRGDLAVQGFVYILDSIALDPVTLTAIGGAVVATCLTRARRDAPIALGIALSAVYVVAAGGDFMSGRFFAASFACAVMLLVRRREWTQQPTLAMAVVVLAVVAAIGSHESSLLTNGRFRHDFTDRDGIVDERRVYYPFTGLMSVERQDGQLTHPWAQHGRDVLASGERVSAYAADGFFGFTLGPAVYALDPFALGDALLAHLPAEAGWRPGHFGRRIPDGYDATLASGVNQIVEPSIHEFYERLQSVTRGPLWSWRRMREIWRFNTGGNATLIARSTYGVRQIPSSDLADRKLEGSWSLAPGVVRVREGGVAVEFGRAVREPLEISLDGNDDYRIVLTFNGREVGRELVRARWPNTDGSLGLAVYRLDANAGRAFDEIHVSAYQGLGAFTLGHVIPTP